MQKLRKIFALLLMLALLAFGAQAEFEEMVEGEYLLTPEDLHAESAILIDAATGTVLFEKNADRAMYPASTTKIMTCLLALEAGGLDNLVTIPKEAGDVPKDSSLMPVHVGEEMTMRDLLYGLMLHSGNDSANAIAAITAGSVESFVARMNEKSAAIGLTGTHWANAHGYHADDHYTTARDMARLAQVAMQNADFCEIVGTPAYIIEPTNKRSERLKMVNSNLMLLSGSEHYYEDVTGIKTGFTNAAGQTFVFSAERGGAKLIGVVMKTADNKDAPQRWQDSKNLLNYGFSRYRTYNFAELYNMGPAAVQIENSIDTDPYAGEMALSIANVAGSYQVACLDGDPSQALSDFRAMLSYSISGDLVAPVSAGTILGTLTLNAPDGQQASATLIASRSIEMQPEVPTIADYLPFLEGVDLHKAGEILKIAGIALVVLFVLRCIARARRNARRRAQRRRAKKAGTSNYYRNSRYYN